MMRIRMGILIGALSLAACATRPMGPPISVDQALQMAKSGQSADAIIQTMREGGMTYLLSASDILRLHDAGMPTPVLDYMLQTELSATRDEQHIRDVDTAPAPAPYYWGWHRW